ncbi:hypothetical protein [Sideroxydans sp. CL21]|uniref:hypothetical protein n=1 Tax=Sideroxydans sp. CL21 TaxID=2600596 RepID=UPI0024BCA53B|nr:hypothetical protein [Sideroxydans sp. CL21]
MNTPSLTIRHLTFTGPNVAPATLNFSNGLNLVYGASNTGKSFTVKAIDFMLGAAKELPEIPEREGYDQVWFGFTFNNSENFTLSRSVSGGGFKLYKGLIKSTDEAKDPELLAPTQQTKSAKSLPHFLLEKLSFSDKRLAKDANGNTDPISFRDIAAISLTDETTIQSEQSPVESGQHITRTKERSVFKLLLTGLDDSAIVPLQDGKTFNTSKAVRIEVINEMLNGIESKLADYPDVTDLPSQYERLSSTLDKLESEFDNVQGTVRNLLDERRFLSTELPRIGQRTEEINIHLGRFAQLESVYQSDIARLLALEEASFLLSLDNEKDCSLCGAPASAQKHKNDHEDISAIRNGADIEIAKIEKQRQEIKLVITNLLAEERALKEQYPQLSQRLDEVEREINQLNPRANDSRLTIREIIDTRDQVKNGLSLLEHKNNLLAKIEEFNSLKKPSKDDKPNLKTPDTATHQLALTISKVLKAWKFPGDCHVSFDDKAHDIKIDGKLRSNNGKGVRAITHAAFKVALLIYCRENSLPHPGFIILDSPLITYRDPIKNPKAGALAEDEKRIAASPLKQSFFEHLSSISHWGQFIILENIDPPAGIETIAHVEVFYGNTGSGRNGLLQN